MSDAGMQGSDGGERRRRTYIEREINGLSAEERLAARRSRCAPLVAALEEWTRSERAKLSRHNAVAKAIDYMLTRWPAFSRFLEDGRICLTNNAAGRLIRSNGSSRRALRPAHPLRRWRAVMV